MRTSPAVGGASTPGRATHLPRLLAATATGTAALLVVAAYLLRAATLIVYPWDWSPGEGLHLDYARRALEAPGTLYHHEVVPFPSAYGPLLPVLLTPVVRTAAPLVGARLVMLLFVVLGTVAVGWHVRRRRGWLWAGASVALVLAPFELTSWNMLVRVDGPMLSLWVCGSLVLLPRRLERGADRLGPGRLGVGAALLLAAVFVKPTAVLHSAPVVLGWLLVDRRSAIRLIATLGVVGLALLGTLQFLTDGAFLWVNGLWGIHPRVPDQTTLILSNFVALSWPVLLLAVVAIVGAVRARGLSWREPEWLLILGGLSVLPLLAKDGAWWNYLLPLFVSLVVASGCWLAEAAGAWSMERSGPDLTRLLPPVLAAFLALLLAGTREFPLPTSEDAATASAFYGYTSLIVEREGGPLLASRPDLVYFEAGQPVEVEGSSFAALAAADAPGTRRVLDRLLARRYTLVVETWPIFEAPEWRQALERGYRHVGGCALGWWFGHRSSHILLRRGLPHGFAFPPGARCAVAAPSPRSAGRRPPGS